SRSSTTSALAAIASSAASASSIDRAPNDTPSMRRRCLTSDTASDTGHLLGRLGDAHLAAVGDALVGRADELEISERVLPVRLRRAAGRDTGEELFELQPEGVLQLQRDLAPLGLGLHLPGVEAEEGRLGLGLRPQPVEAEDQAAVLAVDL